MEHDITIQEKIQKTVTKIDSIRKLIREADENDYVSDMEFLLSIKKNIIKNGSLHEMEASILNDLWKKYK